jgi:hypothetical protein
MDREEKNMNVVTTIIPLNAAVASCAHTFYTFSRDSQ